MSNSGTRTTEVTPLGHETESVPMLRLTDNIRSLHHLWEEYLFDIGDYKPAKDFTNDEVNGQGKAFANKYSTRFGVYRPI